MGLSKAFVSIYLPSTIINPQNSTYLIKAQIFEHEIELIAFFFVQKKIVQETHLIFWYQVVAYVVKP